MGGEWRRVAIGSVCESIIDCVNKTAPVVSYPTPYRMIRTTNIKSGRLDLSGARFVDEETYKVWTRRAAPQRGDVLLTREAPLGEVAIVRDEERVFLGQRIMQYRADRSMLDPQFLFYSFQGADVQAQIHAHGGSGSTVDHIRVPDCSKFEVLVPPLEEQRAIAHILGTLDDKIELNRRMNETLESIARALFQSWFVDFDPVRAKAEGRDTGLPKHIADLFPDSFEESELGEIPTGWSLRELADVLVTLEVGGRPKGGVSEYTFGVPSIGAESIVGLGRFDFSKTRFVPQEFYDRMNRGHVQSRDVFLYKDGGRPGEFEPHVAMFGDGFPFTACAINEHVYRLRACEAFGQNLLFFWLSSDFAMEEMRIKGTGVAIPGLNSTQAKSLTTLVPAPQIARAFDALVNPWISRILSACNESRTLAILRDTLLPKLISSELRVKDADRFVGGTVS